MHAQTRPCSEIHAGESDAVRANMISACERERDFNRARETQQNNSNNGSNTNAPFVECNQTYSSAVPAPVAPFTPVEYFAAPNAEPLTVIPPAPASPMAIPVNMSEPVKYCRGYELISNRFGASLSAGNERRASADNKIFCVRKSGITADWESCTSALGLYNAIVVAEAAMQVFQGVQSNNVQNQINNDVSQRAAQGDAQNAAYDAQVKQARSAQSLNQQQATAYAAAVAALYSKIQSWIKETPEAVIQKGCGDTAPSATNRPPATPTPQLYVSKEAVPTTGPRGNETCSAAAREATQRYAGFVFANRDAKAAFTTAAMMFAAKAIAAGIKASQLGNIAKKVEEAKKQTEDQYDAPTFERCQLTPNDPACAGAVTRSSGSGLQDGGFGFGDSFGNNAFNPLGDEEKLGDIAPLPLPGEDTVAGVSNPFADDAKNAAGIIDPAGAASVQPGAAGGGGGGGGAPGGGGGSASLGNDTPGMDDSKKESDIKANKADGKYNVAGGGAFQAIKGMKEENPFANLFDGKAGGKLEEDRSIASGDIDGQDSGLFSKISKRYGQVQADKRLEAKNLEE